MACGKKRVEHLRFALEFDFYDVIRARDYGIADFYIMFSRCMESNHM
jgi:hypothetical protein